MPAWHSEYPATAVDGYLPTTTGLRVIKSQNTLMHLNPDEQFRLAKRGERIGNEAQNVGQNMHGGEEDI